MLPFPENVIAVEEECGVVNVSWEDRESVVPSTCQKGPLVSVNITISWRRRDGGTGYERAGHGNSHLLTLDYSETGPLEIFSSSVCNKSTFTHYEGKIMTH